MRGPAKRVRLVHVKSEFKTRVLGKRSRFSTKKREEEENSNSPRGSEGKHGDCNKKNRPKADKKASGEGAL